MQIALLFELFNDYQCDLVCVGCTMIEKRDAVQYGNGLREVRDESGWA